jgi:hypothetical protein
MHDNPARYQIRAYVRRLRRLEGDKLAETDMLVAVASSEREANAFQQVLIGEVAYLWERLSHDTEITDRPGEGADSKSTYVG